MELGRTQSETAAPGSAEEKRKSQSENSPVTHSSTMPTTLGKDPHDEGISSASADPDGEASGSTTVGGPSKASASEMLDTTQPNGEARQRKGGLWAKIRRKDKDSGERASRDEGDSKPRKRSQFSVASQIRATILNSYINLLLVAVPVGIALNFVPSVSRLTVFVVNFIAIIPLAAMLSYATEEIALHTGETIGGLLNATFG